MNHHLDPGAVADETRASAGWPPLSSAEVRELWAFIHGDIMVAGIREHLRSSLGLCPRHTWGYAIAEIELWVHGAGSRGGHQPFDVCVLYSDLLDHVATQLIAHHRFRSDLRPLVRPSAPCRVCQALTFTGTRNLPGFAGMNIQTLCLAPGLMEALNPREDESHGGTEEVPGGASGASDPARGGRSEGPGFSAWRGASGR